MICPKCGCDNVKIESVDWASLGMEALKGTLQVGYWAFKITSGITENFGNPGKLASMASKVVAGCIKEGAE